MGERLRQRPRELTKAELEIMRILWDRGGGFVNDVLAELSEPKPAYNTVSTIIRILEKKGFVAHRAYGKSYEYYPTVDRDTYTHGFMSSVLDMFFGGSTERLVSFLASRRSISVKETDAIIEMLKREKR